jgi:hypothetical protein
MVSGFATIPRRASSQSHRDTREGSRARAESRWGGETIPRAAAEHVSMCQACQSQLKEYIEMGVELRRVASLDAESEVKDRTWEKQRGTLRRWWQKGWETMRIPRMAFVSLLTVVVALSSGLTLIGVRAHERGTVAILKIAPPDEETVMNIMPCPLSTENKKSSDCYNSVGMKSGSFSYKIELLSRDGNRIQLGVRAAFVNRADSTETVAQKLQGATERAYWFEPGETLKIDVDGLGPVVVTGEWQDHMPYFATMDVEHNLEPGPNELRMISPILLRSDRVVFDAKGGAATSSGPKAAFWVNVPGNGVYVFSMSPMPDSVQAHAVDNRVTFEIGGQSYQFVTGAPITRAEKVWILHRAGANSPMNGVFGSGSSDVLLPLLQAK